MRVVVSAPPWVWLAGLVALSALVRFLLARRVAAPWIMVDELIYSELAKSFAASGELFIREEPFARYGPVYPLLLSPAYRAFAAIPDVYTAAKAINAVVMSLAALPTYVLARRLLTPALSLAAALLAVAVPSMAYTGTLMTENVAYPLVVAAVLALVLTLERPTLPRALALLALCALAFLTRAQALALLPGVVAAPMLLALFRRRLREVLAYAPLYAAIAAATLVVASVQLARGRAVTDVLGAYSFVSDLEYPPGEVAKWLVYHIAALDLYVGILPFAALLLLLARPDRLRGREQAFLAAAVSVSAAFIFEVAAFAASLPWVHRVAERSMFYVAPLFVVALLLWIQRGLPRPRLVASASALVAAGLPGVLPYASLLNPNVSSDTLVLVPWLRLREDLLSAGQVRVVVLVAALAAVALFLRVPVRLAALVPIALVAYFVLVLVAVENQFRAQGSAALAAVAGRGDPDWLDRAIGRDQASAVVWSNRTRALGVWDTEFFNRSAGRVYDLAAAMPGRLPEERAGIGASGLLRDHLGRLVFGPFALADRSVLLAGRPVARAASGEFTLYRVDGPVRIAAVVTGRYPNELWFRPRATYTRFGCRGGMLTLGIESEPTVFPAGQTVTATGDGHASIRIARGEARALRIPLRARDGRCRVTLVSRPSSLREGVVALPGPRRLGMRVTLLAWDPA